jgi:hypothetical protein
MLFDEALLTTDIEIRMRSTATHMWTKYKIMKNLPAYEKQNFGLH